MSSEKKAYNGWAGGYETWNVALWIGNEEGSSRYWQEQAEECAAEAVADKVFTRKENAAYELAKRLEQEIKDNAPELEGCYGDLLGAALSEVDWREIAESMIGDLDDDVWEEEEDEEMEELDEDVDLDDDDEEESE